MKKPTQEKKKMKIAISDANIFIDLCELQALTWFAELELEVHTTDWVLDELSSTQREIVLPMISKIHAVQLEDIGQFEVSKGLSNQDRSILFVAQHLRKDTFSVITNDKLIRNWCIKESIEVHGFLWLLDALVEKKILSHTSAAHYLLSLMRINQWLPQQECKMRLDNWGR